MIHSNKCIFGISFIFFLLSMSQLALSQNLMQKLRSGQQTIHFAEALEKGQLHHKLNGDGPYTIFVPSNKAFESVSNKMRTNGDLLLNHIITGMATERNLKLMSQVTCLSGKTIKIKSGKKEEILINAFPLQTSNIKADNGVIHIIDGVIK